MKVDVLEAELGNVGQIDEQGVLDELDHIDYLALVCLLHENLRCLDELFLGAMNRVLIRSMDQRHDLAG